MDIRGFEVVSAFEEQDINLPTRKTTESAGYDIECAEAVTLEPGQVVLVPTALKLHGIRRITCYPYPF